MSSAARIAQLIRDIAGECVLQEGPVLVIAPRTVDVLPRILGVARAENYRIMVLGRGSSFAPDFSLLRENVIALMTTAIVGVESRSPFTDRVFVGTPVDFVVKAEGDIRKRTIGGLISSSPSLQRNQFLNALWPKVRRIEVLTAKGEFRMLCGPSSAYADDPGMANLLIGAHGRLGMIISILLATPLPIAYRSEINDPEVRSESTGTVGVIEREEMEKLLDPEGLFKW